MPAPLSSAASAQYAALIAKSGLTAQIRSLSSDVAEACETVNALNWAEDLAGLGIAIPSGDDRESFGKSLAAAFGAVATQATGSKRGASVRFVDGDDGLEVAVTFRTVKTRS